MASSLKWPAASYAPTLVGSGNASRGGKKMTYHRFVKEILSQRINATNSTGNVEIATQYATDNYLKVSFY